MIHGAGLLLIEGPLQNLDGVAMCGHASSSAWTAYNLRAQLPSSHDFR